MSTRKNVSWRVSEHPQSDQINAWLDQQKNIQDSITNIVFHMIDRFGMRNITDYDIQKQLYNDSIAYGGPVVPQQAQAPIQTTVPEAKPEAQPASEEEPEHQEPAQQPPAEQQPAVNQEQKYEEDDPFGDVDPENL
ncbi:MAG: hypothetical protein ACI35R_06765 [Bacillus sp. (in: firmicutes)]